MKYHVILPSGDLADGKWERSEEIPDVVRNRRGRLVKTDRLKILVEDDIGEEYEVSKWDL